MDGLFLKLPETSIFDEVNPAKLVIPGKIKRNQRLALWFLFVIYVYYIFITATFEGQLPITQIISVDTLIFFVLFLMAYYVSFDRYLIILKNNSGWIIETIKGNSMIKFRTHSIRADELSVEIKQFSRKLKFTAILRIHSSETFNDEIIKFITINQTIKSIMEDLDYLDIPIRRKTLKDRPKKSVN